MITTELTATSALEVGNYEAPAMKVVELASEGVLCSSFEKWNEDEIDW